MIAAIEGGITAPEGFRAAGVHCGIKPSKLDLALVVSEHPASAVGLFTTNRAQAAPVTISRQHLDATGGIARAIVVNSGCANACTGHAGLTVAHMMAAETARAIDCVAEEVLVASTGVIGVQLDPRTVADGIIAAAERLTTDGHADAAEAIMTTDVAPKAYAVQVDGPAGRFRVGGMAKGAGMIEPNMATMLAFVTCDARVSPALLRRAVVEACDDTFNAITVDGDSSTNDTLFAVANGASGTDVDAASYDTLVEGLRAVCLPLAKQIVSGGEGATKLVEVRVTGARTVEEARRAARTIANSLLVKTAVHGGDPNWGRLLAAAGRAGVDFSLNGARVAIGPTVLFEDGRPFDERAAKAAEYLKGRDIRLTVDVGAGGQADATIWTCDLSAEYVRINGEYRT